MQYIINSNGIVLFIDNKPFKFERGSMQYAKILEKFDLPEDEQDAAIRQVIQKTSPNAEKNGFKISPESVSYLGEELPESLADKVRDIHEEGLPLSLFEKFWENLQLNPSSSSVRELYEFLSYKELPLTEDGCFLAYKGLTVISGALVATKKQRSSAVKSTLQETSLMELVKRSKFVAGMLTTIETIIARLVFTLAVLITLAVSLREQWLLLRLILKTL